MKYILQSEVTNIGGGYEHKLIDEKGNVLDSGLLKRLGSLDLKKSTKSIIEKYVLLNESQLTGGTIGLSKVEIKLEIKEL